MGIQQVAAALFNQPIDNLQVDAPQRARKASNIVVPAGGTNSANFFLDFPGLPSMVRGMALLLEHVKFMISASAAPGLGIAAGQIALGYRDSSNVPQVLSYEAGQITATGLNVIGPVSVDMPPLLATDQDLALESFVGFAVPNPVVLPLVGPFELSANLSFVNSAAGAITATVLMAAKMRFIRGIQEN